MKWVVVRFPGSLDDDDVVYALREVLAQDVSIVWHRTESLGAADCVVLPGGFSYGDYLRCGAIARFSPIMKSVKRFATEGGLVLGICNGFQILCEAHLLPGALTRNESLSFVCVMATVRVENRQTPFTKQLEIGDVLQIPVSHGEGRYVADDATLELLERERRVLFRYVRPDGGPAG